MTLCGDADGMVSGAKHTTAATIRPGLQVLRTKDSPLVSSVFFMCLPDKARILVSYSAFCIQGHVEAKLWQSCICEFYSC